jgi:hypothetical protein
MLRLRDRLVATRPLLSSAAMLLEPNHPVHSEHVTASLMKEATSLIPSHELAAALGPYRFVRDDAGEA